MTYKVILLTNRQTDRQTDRQTEVKTVPPPNNGRSVYSTRA